MRERVCRLVRAGEQVFARILERGYGESVWRLYEEYEVTAELPRLVAEAEGERGAAETGCDPGPAAGNGAGGNAPPPSLSRLEE